MKKILFLLLLSVSMYGQTLQNPTFGVVTEKTNLEDNSATKVKVQDDNGKSGWTLKGGGLIGYSNSELTGNSINAYNSIDGLVNNSSNSEPHIVRMSNNNLLLAYRKSASYKHIGNDGYIAGRISTDEGVSWGTEFTIFSDSYDDRNAIIGLAPNNDIIVVFRRYDNNTLTNIDFGYVKSSDNGSTWGSYNIIENNVSVTAAQPFGNIIKRGTDLYFVVGVTDSGNNKFRLYKSTNNMSSTTFTDMIGNITNNGVEPFLIDISGGKSIMLVRNNDYVNTGQQSFYQYNSVDGVNFTYKGITNMWSDKNYSMGTPVGAYYDSVTDDFFIVTNQRWITHAINPNQIYDELRVYTQKAESVYTSQTNYILKHNIPRPKASDWRFYGYPSLVKSGTGILTVLCDASSYNRIDQNEDSDLFSFRIDPQSTIKQLINRDIDNSKVAVNNGYNKLKDYVDFNTISKGSRYEDFLKIIDFNKNPTINRLPKLNISNTYSDSQFLDDGSLIRIGSVPTNLSGQTDALFYQRKNTGPSVFSIVGNVASLNSGAAGFYFYNSNSTLISGGFEFGVGSVLNAGNLKVRVRSAGGTLLTPMTFNEDGSLIFGTTPATSAGTPTVLTRNTSTGAVETLPLSSIARPYKVYTALISQSGTSAPTAIVLENTLGATVTFGYSSVGFFTATTSGAVLTTDKTFVTLGIGNSTMTNNVIRAIPTSTSVVNIQTMNGSLVSANGIIDSRATFEIRVYN